MSDWLPQNDSALCLLGRQLVSGGTGHETALGITPAQLVAISTALDACEAAITDLGSVALAYKNAVTARDSTRAGLEPLMRAVNRAVHAKAGVEPGLITAMGLPVYDTTPSRAPAPTTRPLIIVDASQRLMHTLHFRDEAAPKRRAKPDGVLDIEIRCKLGAPPPAGPNECSLLGVTNKTEFQAQFVEADAGKPAQYVARWRNSHNECGPWSETVAATVAG